MNRVLNEDTVTKPFQEKIKTLELTIPLFAIFQQNIKSGW